jgi:hypothetical protein
LNTRSEQTLQGHVILNISAPGNGRNFSSSLEAEQLRLQQRSCHSTRIIMVSIADAKFALIAQQLELFNAFPNVPGRIRQLGVLKIRFDE